MPESFAPPGGCCTPCEDVPVANVPGPTGSAGAAGTNGSDGVNAFTTTTAIFAMPAVSATVSVTVEDTSWIGVGQFLLVVTAGIFSVSSITDTTTVVLTNNGDAVNVDPTTSIALGQTVTPAGPEGSVLSGETAGGDLTGTYLNPTLGIPLVKGDILVGNGAARVLVNVGANHRRLRANSAAATGVDWELVDLSSATEVTGVTPIANGGSNGATKLAGFDNLSPVTTRGDIIIRDASNNVRLPVGTAGQVVGTSDGIDVSFINPTGSNKSMVVLEDQKAIGAAGGAAATTTWSTRTLTTEVLDPDGVCVLAANQFVLSAGTYRVTAYSPCGVISTNELSIITHACRIQNITAGTELVRSINVINPSTAILEGRFTVAAAQSLELQYFFSRSSGANDLGRAFSSAVTGVFGKVTLFKEV